MFDRFSYSHQMLFELPFFSGSVSDAVGYIHQQVDAGQFVAVATPNPEQIMQAEKTDLKKSWQAFTLFIPDGNGIVWASKRLKKPLPHRVAGVEVVEELLESLKKRGETALVVGGEDYEEALLAHVQYPALQWFPGFQKNSSESTTKVLELIKKTQPTYVFVALGAPYQERWVAEHQDVLKKAGVKCVMVVGGAFDMILGQVSRAPLLMRELQLEWLWRLMQEPSRLVRQLRGARFFWNLYFQKI